MARLRRPGLFVGFALLFFAVAAIAAPSTRAATPTPPPCITIQQAIEQGLIQATFTANGDLFFRDAIDYAVVNESQQQLNLCISTGLILQGNPQNQPLLVGQAITTTLRVDENKKGKLSVFCTDVKRHAPSAGDVYTVKGMAEGNLLQVAQVIERRHANGRLGAQLAVWNITNDFSLAGLDRLPSGEGADDPIQVIRPLLSLASGELRLGQEILDEAAPGAKLYTGDLPPGSSVDIPGVGDISRILDTWDSLTRRWDSASQTYQRVRSIGPLVVAAIPLICCVLPLAGIFSVFMLRRR